MDISDEACSEASGTLFEDEAAISILAADVVDDDPTGKIDTRSNEKRSFASLSLIEPLVVKPRPYQVEMVQASLERNIIVAVCAYHPQE